MRAQGLMPTSMTLRKGDKPVSVPSGPRGDSSAPLRSDDDRRRGSHLRSPSRSSYARRRDHSPFDDDRRSSRRTDTGKRETLYRDISAERAAWKARQRPRERDRETSRGGGEEGEVVEPSTNTTTRRNARSRSRESNFNSYRPARRESRSPPPRRTRRDSRSRSPPRFRDRERDRRREESLPRRRARSRSPPGIDREKEKGTETRRQGKELDGAKEEKVMPEPEKEEEKVGEKTGEETKREKSAEAEEEITAKEVVVPGAEHEQDNPGERKPETETKGVRESSGDDIH
ncbi:hypothetical protein LTR33_014702 [Friedmanniomyces endolithicus]|nr:hypothetical protein LTR33_014702 [Friedmanniomyces endolithicus]